MSSLSAHTPPDESLICDEHHDSDRPRVLSPVGTEEAQRMAEFFGVLADPTRLRLLSLLASEECCVCDLAALLDVSESAVSHQLRALKAARIVRYRKVGRQVFYRLDDHHVVDLYQTVREHLAEPIPRAATPGV